MKCPYCNSVLSEDSKFCEKCGQEIATTVDNSQVSSNFWADYQSKTSKDVSAYQAKMQKENDEQKAKRNKIIAAGIAVALIIAVVIYATVIQPANQYSEASELFAAEQYEEAAKIFQSLDDYKDASDRLVESNYYWAEQLFEQGDYYSARTLWEPMGTYLTANMRVDACNVAIAYQLIEKGNIAEAAILLGKIEFDKLAIMKGYELWDQIIYPTCLDAGVYWPYSWPDDYTAGLLSNGEIIAYGYEEKDFWKQWENLTSICCTSEGVIGLNSVGKLYYSFGEYCNYDVSKWDRIVDIKAENHFILGLRADGTVLATVDHYSDNYDWVYGVESWSNIVCISTSENHVLGVTANGSVMAVGDSYADKQCEVDGWRNVIGVAAGYDHSVAVKRDGTVVAVGIEGPAGMAWGTQDNDGRLEVGDWSNVVRVFAGYDYTVGLRADGTVVATGGNDQGQCDVLGWTNIVDIVIGSNCTIGIKSDGSVVTTGKSDISSWTSIRVPGKKVSNWIHSN